MMMHGMIWMHVIGLIMLLAFAYILWVLSDKESGNMKMTGMTLSILIIIIAVVMFLGSLVYGGRMGKDKCGCMMSSCDMKGGMMMNMSDKEMKEKMDMMMKNPKMHEMMKKEMMEYKK